MPHAYRPYVNGMGRREEGAGVALDKQNTMSPTSHSEPRTRTRYAICVAGRTFDICEAAAVAVV